VTGDKGVSRPAVPNEEVALPRVPRTHAGPGRRGAFRRRPAPVAIGGERFGPGGIPAEETSEISRLRGSAHICAAPAGPVRRRVSRLMLSGAFPAAMRWPFPRHLAAHPLTSGAQLPHGVMAACRLARRALAKGPSAEAAIGDAGVRPTSRSGRRAGRTGPARLADGGGRVGCNKGQAGSPAAPADIMSCRTRIKVTCHAGRLGTGRRAAGQHAGCNQS
jgi:hypothetical protein